jgi:hypothetical protein
VNKPDRVPPQGSLLVCHSPKLSDGLIWLRVVRTTMDLHWPEYWLCVFPPDEIPMPLQEFMAVHDICKETSLGRRTKMNEVNTQTYIITAEGNLHLFGIE